MLSMASNSSLPDISQDKELLARREQLGLSGEEHWSESSCTRIGEAYRRVCHRVLGRTLKKLFQPIRGEQDQREERARA